MGEIDTSAECVAGVLEDLFDLRTTQARKAAALIRALAAERDEARAKTIEECAQRVIAYCRDMNEARRQPLFSNVVPLIRALSTEAGDGR